MTAQGRLEFGGAGAWDVGLDEVGRGPLAGPVVTAAVILGDSNVEGVADSKALTTRQRERVAARIRGEAAAWAVARAEPHEIDRFNIRGATLLAMERAWGALDESPAYAWVDGRDLPRLPCPGEPVIGGDARVAVIAAASILAKQARDRLMITHADDFPGYGFASHKGYPTQQHLAALDRLGPCDLHRRSFAPVYRRLPR